MIMTNRIVLTVLGFTVFLGTMFAADWPAFRGSRGGVADDTDLPVKWEKDNILWKVKLPGPGASSPITHGDKIFITCYSGYGTKISAGFGGKGGKGGGKGGFGGGPDEGGDQKNLKLHLLCLDRAKGDILWKKDIDPKLPEEPFSGFLRDHGYATSTPVTDGERVYVFFGKTGVFAFDMKGEKVWEADVGKGVNKWGSGASPIVHKGLVIINAAIESKALIALDTKTGKEVWRARGVSTSWSTPVLAETKDQGFEVVLSQAGKVVGYDLEKGTELWHCQGIGGGEGGKGGKGGFGGFGGGGGGYTSSSPVTKDGVVYVSGGGGPNPQTTLAVKAGGKGDVNKSHVVWRKSIGTGIASPVLQGEYLCWVNGTATCLKTTDGATAGTERVYSSRNEYVSAVAAGDKIFALTRTDGLYVLSTAGGKVQELAHNEFPGDTSIFNASPAVSNGRMYLRSNAYLYCVGKK